MLWAFVLKVMAAVVLTALYTYYYTDKQNSDIYKYFEDGLAMHTIFFHSPRLFFQLLFEINIETPDVLSVIQNFNHWNPKVRSMVYNDNRFVIKLNALFSFISLGSIYIHSLLGALMSFAGITAIAKTGEKLLPKFRNGALLLLFFPSVIFWTSALLKETVLVFVFGLFLWNVVQFFNSFNWQRIILVFILFGLLALLKVYVILCLLPPALAFVAVRNQKSLLRIILTFLTITLLCALAVFAIDTFVLNHRIITGIVQKQRDMFNLAVYMQAGSLIYVPTVSVDNVFSFVPAALYGVFNVLFQPLLWKVTSPLLLAAAIENILLMLLIIGFIFQVKKMDEHEWKVSLFCLLFVLLLFAIIGITTPVIGSIVRYRVPGLLLLLFPLSMSLNYWKRERR